MNIGRRSHFVHVAQFAAIRETGARVDTIMQNVRNVKLPDPRLISGIVQTAVFGGAGAYGLYHSLFNVEGGHRAIVYNRFVGIREKVRPRRPRRRPR